MRPLSFRRLPGCTGAGTSSTSLDIGGRQGNLTSRVITPTILTSKVVNLGPLALYFGVPSIQPLVL